jgi:hypothetical protein
MGNGEHTRLLGVLHPNPGKVSMSPDKAMIDLLSHIEWLNL